MFIPSATARSGGIDEDEFSILLGSDGELGFVDGRNAVPHCNQLPIDDDHALGGSEIAMAGSGEQSFARLLALQRRKSRE